MWAKTADLEARSRRKNIRITGLPESIEGPRPTAFFSDLLTQLLGDQILPTSPELVRAHRSLAVKPKPGERPRPVIIRFHNFQTKERVIREARKMRADLRYEGKPIAFYEDYIPEVVMQRALYREVMAQLYKLGLRPALQCPAKLMITAENGDKVRLSSVEEAKSGHTLHVLPCLPPTAARERQARRARHQSSRVAGRAAAVISVFGEGGMVQEDVEKLEQ
ncbi:hypothetical protein KUCAC02_017419 [Chaenocephalus aceratus]|uniref:Uncharacterized protein n=1 Tax=Chaenocephalus aceratus TaxID=36190 RepID=A0ACB9W1C5_CHAAC|nr:hypothetical protein KUCAC02_017419 [Chaenocephalus aceratus]